MKHIEINELEKLVSIILIVIFFRRT